jgi:hypothetical protein
VGQCSTLDREATANSAHFGAVRWLRPGRPFGVKTRKSAAAMVRSAFPPTTDSERTSEIPHCIGAPKATPADVVATLNRRINASLAEPGLKART